MRAKTEDIRYLVFDVLEIKAKNFGRLLAGIRASGERRRSYLIRIFDEKAAASFHRIKDILKEVTLFFLNWRLLFLDL